MTTRTAQRASSERAGRWAVGSDMPARHACRALAPLACARLLQPQPALHSTGMLPIQQAHRITYLCSHQTGSAAKCHARFRTPAPLPGACCCPTRPAACCSRGAGTMTLWWARGRRPWRASVLLSTTSASTAASLSSRAGGQARLASRQAAARQLQAEWCTHTNIARPCLNSQDYAHRAAAPGSHSTAAGKAWA